MAVPDIIRECERLGMTAIGITDHLNSFDRLGLHDMIRHDILNTKTGIQVYFGAELDFLGPDRGFAFSPEVQEQHGFQFAIGGIHNPYAGIYDLTKIIDIQHRHHIRTCEDPLVDVLVHPYWFNKTIFDENNWPWFDSMKLVPEKYARELGRTAAETGTAIELNSDAVLSNSSYSMRFINEYFDFLSAVAEEGATFSVGSDAHDINCLKNIRACWNAVEKLGLTPDRIWRPACKPLAGGNP